MKRKIILSSFILWSLYNFKLYSQAHNNILKDKIWEIVSIDSAGQKVDFPKERKYLLESVDFSSKKCEKCKLFWKKNRKIYKKSGFNGMYIYTDEKDANSKYYAQIKAYYKVDHNRIKIIWDDLFKVQEQLNKVNPKISFWMLCALNSDGKIEQNGDIIELSTEKDNYTSANVQVKITLKVFQR